MVGISWGVVEGLVVCVSGREEVVEVVALDVVGVAGAASVKSG